MEGITRQVGHYSGRGRWYWSASDNRGAFIADHEVSLPESDPQWAAFTRLSRYLRRHIDPARPLSSEADIITWLGQWITARAFGPIAPALTERAPATVALQFPAATPAEARALLYRPWEL